MDPAVRAYYGLLHHTGFPGITGCAFQWQQQVTGNGRPIQISEVPPPLENVRRDAEVVAIIASGNCPNPGLDIIRYDQKDSPYVYNMDHYQVIENLPRHPAYQQVLKIAGIQDSEALRETLNSWIFLLGPEKTDDHWRKTLPEFLQKETNKPSAPETPS